MAIHHPATHPANSFSLGEMLRIAGMTLVAGIAVGYLLVNYDDGTLQILARIASSVALVTAVMMIFEARRRRHIDAVRARLDRIEELLDVRLERQRRWDAYSDALADLGGINPEDSGDIPINRHRS